MLNNKKVSLALGSGSAKGAAHIGVIETLHKNDYEITAIAGTSIGAVVATFYALGKLEELKEWFTSFDKVKTFKILDISFGGGLMSGNKFMKGIEEIIGHARFEDTDIPLYIVATNLTLGTREIFSKGEILPAIRASISVPGMFKPFKHKGHYYVDGAVTAPVPVEALATNKHKNIVAVNLQYDDGFDEKIDMGMLSVASRSIEILSKHLSTRQMLEAKIVIVPTLVDVKMFDMHRSEELILEGARATQIAIDNGGLDPEWKQFLRKQLPQSRKFKL